MARLWKSVWTVTWKTAVIMVLWGALLAPVTILFYRNQSTGSTPPLQERLVLEVAAGISIVLATWVMVRWVDRRPWNTSGLAFVRVSSDGLAGLGIGAGMMAVSLALLAAAGCVQVQPGIEVDGSSLLVSGIALAFNSVMQEVLVRGYFFQTIRSQSGPGFALVFTSIVFVLLHRGTGSVLSNANLFLAGVVFGIGYLRTGNLWLPIGLHFAWNFILGPLLGMTVSGQSIDCGWRMLVLRGPVWITGGTFGMEGGLAATAAMLGGIVFLNRWFRRRSVRP
jgi:membrane protease YdiL (CAAX protease family)